MYSNLLISLQFFSEYKSLIWYPREWVTQIKYIQPVSRYWVPAFFFGMNAEDKKVKKFLYEKYGIALSLCQWWKSANTVSGILLLTFFGKIA